MITCLIRYTIDENKVADFEQYARVWMNLIEKYGGTHHGYFLPHDAPPPAAFSFADIGADGPPLSPLRSSVFPMLQLTRNTGVRWRKTMNAPPRLGTTTKRNALPATSEPS